MGKWRNAAVGVAGASPGWERVLEQLGVPRHAARPGEDAVLVVEGWPSVEVERALEDGAVVLACGVEGDGYLGPGTLTTITRVHAGDAEDPVAAPCLAWLYQGPGWGAVRRHEDRLVKGLHEPGVHALVHERRVGSGTLLATGVPLTRLLVAVGDRLRPLSPIGPVTERIASADTAGIEALLARMVSRAFELAGLPLVRRAPFPHGARSVLLTRIDVDGDPRGRLADLVQVADRLELPLSIFINGSLTEDHPLPPIGDLHEVGHHGWHHNVFDRIDDNLENLVAGQNWLEARIGGTVHSFVGPRGLWNHALDAALARLGYGYSSEFGLAVDGLPFRTPAGLLQIPVHAYSPERAAVHAEEAARPAPTGEEIVAHYVATFHRHLGLGRPIHLYGHPTRLGEVADRVLPELATAARRHGIPMMTLGEMAAWWQEREQSGLQVEVDRDSGEVHTRFEGRPVPLRGLPMDGSTSRTKFSRHAVARGRT